MKQQQYMLVSQNPSTWKINLFFSCSIAEFHRTPTFASKCLYQGQECAAGQVRGLTGGPITISSWMGVILT